MKIKQKQARVSRELFALLSRPENIYSSKYVAIRRFIAPNGVRKPLFVVTISKKEVPTAVKRNLLKRRYRHLCQKVFLGVSPAVLQCIIKKGALTATHQELWLDASAARSKIH